MRIASMIITALLTSSATISAEPNEQDLNTKLVKLMETTKVVARMGLDVPSTEYKSDGDPETLELVFLDKKKDGPSRVSDDGQVIFLYKASDKKQQELITQAFIIRARLDLKN
jgi:hypothetical protein